MSSARSMDVQPEPLKPLSSRPSMIEGTMRTVSVLTLLIVVLRQRKLVYVCAGILFVIAATIGLFSDRTYTSVASFMPQGSRSTAGLGALAAQFGVNVGSAGSDGSLSPDFYVGLIRSRTVLGAVVDSEYQIGAGPSKIALVRAFKIRLSDSLRAREAAIKKLDEAIDAAAMAKTGVVQVSVATPFPVLSFQVVRRIIDEVNRFNQQTRHSQASAERQFTEQRLNEVRSELRAAEDAIEAFESSNREFRSSPALNSRYERLTREAGRLSGVYLEVSQAFERAKVEEVRDTPVISMVDRPEVAVLPNPRGVVSKSLVALMAGALLGIFIAFTRDFFRRAPRAEDEEAEFIFLVHEAIGELSHPWRLITRRVRSGAQA